MAVMLLMAISKNLIIFPGFRDGDNSGSFSGKFLRNSLIILVSPKILFTNETLIPNYYVISSSRGFSVNDVS